MKTLFAGPFVGEFGWELFGWQSYIRAYAKNFDNVIVSSRPENSYLYKDFYTEFIPYDPGSYHCDSYICVGHRYRDIHSKFKPTEWLYLDHPHKAFKWMEKRDQTFQLYGNSSKKEMGYDLVIHARMVQKGNKYRLDRNWPQRNWVDFLDKISDMNFKVASIGKSGMAVHLPNTDNQLDIPLESLADILRNSKMIIGPSSGPMHFATLCGCPQMLWTSNVRAKGSGNKDRYERIWNPFNTPVCVHEEESWHPSPITIYDKFSNFYENLGREII